MVANSSNTLLEGENFQSVLYIYPHLPKRKLDTMSEHQLNQRHQAAKAFTESLEQLDDILLKGTQPAEARPDKTETYKIDAHAWEDAAADLDQFFGDVQPTEDA